MKRDVNRKAHLRTIIQEPYQGSRTRRLTGSAGRQPRTSNGPTTPQRSKQDQTKTSSARRKLQLVSVPKDPVSIALRVREC